jgi:hypothetical protein
MGRFAVLASGNAGFSTVRGDLGGLFLGMAMFTLIGAIRASSRRLAVPSAFLGFIVPGRILNLLFDGRTSMRRFWGMRRRFSKVPSVWARTGCW